MSEPTVAVIGGGVQGVCAALALARSGARVTLIEATDALLDRASFRSEWKIHLGFVYANDPTGQTAELMLDAALHFAPLIDRWIGPVDWSRLRSRPFAYATLPDSQLPADQLRCHYERIDQRYRETYRASGLNYLGLTPETLLPAPDSTSLWSSWRATTGALIANTAEVAMARTGFRDLMRDAIATARGITVRTGHRVEHVSRTAAGFRVSGIDATGTPWTEQCTQVVNCSWTDRLRLDRQLGIEPDRPWVYRLKYRMLGRLAGAARQPSLTFALGPYGDVVTYNDDRVYVSWYPVCLRGWSSDVSPPAAWEDACSGHTSSADLSEVRSAVLREFGAILPALRDTRVDTVDAGVIFSWGTRDIDQPTSELHRRSEIGVSGSNGHYTINTGKFTCAPLFADRLVTRMRTDGCLV